MLNQYSFITIAILFIIVAGLLLLKNKPKVRDYIAFGAVIFAFLAAWFILHPTQTLLMGEAQKVQSMIGAGKPVLLEFQSPYCVGCIAIKPLVDELEQELGAELLFLRINIQEQVGKDLAPVYGFEFTPTFIYFDERGKEVWRTVGVFDPQKVRDTLAKP